MSVPGLRAEYSNPHISTRLTLKSKDDACVPAQGRLGVQIELYQVLGHRWVEAALLAELPASIRRSSWVGTVVDPPGAAVLPP